MKRAVGLLVVFAMLLAACQSKKEPDLSAGYEYFPLETGTFAEYEVIETRYFMWQEPLTRVYQVREDIASPYTDAEGKTVYRIQRSVKYNGEDWQPDSVMQAWRTADRGIRVENGNPIVKLRFPVASMSQWDGNEYNSVGEQRFKIQEVGHTVQIGATDFENTLTVLQQNDSSLVSLKRIREVFAPGVGLIKKEKTVLNYCSVGECARKGHVDFGIRQITTIYRSGKL